MVKRYHYLVIIGVSIIGIIFGSIFDLSIAKQVFSDKNFFGLIFAVLGETPLFLGVAFLGGMLFYISLKNSWSDKKSLNNFIKILFCVLGIGAYCVGGYFAGSHIFNINGFNIPKLKILGLAIGFILGAVFFGLGLLVCKKSDNPFKFFKPVIVLLTAAALMTVLINFVAKPLFCRPRFRWMMEEEFELRVTCFCQWWESGKEHLDYYTNFTLPENLSALKENFKSFPSGHAAAACFAPMLLVFLPTLFKKLEKYKTLLFYSGFVFTLIVSFSRMTLGAHYLSDVCFGMLIMSVISLLADLIFFKKEKESVN